MSRCGTGDDHCCWFSGVACKYVAPSDNPDFNWQCTLRTELGSWDAVHNDARYKQDVIPLIDALGKGQHKGKHCGDYGPEGWGNCMTCNPIDWDAYYGD